MSGTPGEGRHSSVDIVATSLCNLQDAGHTETGAGMRVILYNNILLKLFDACNNLAQGNRTTDAGHILQTDFIGTGLNEGLCQINVILYRMNGAVGDAESCLCNHACLLGILDRGNNVTCVVQSTEDTGDIRTLCLLDLVEKLTYILGNGTHAQTVQGAVQHVGLNTCLMEGLCPLADTLVRVLAIEKVYLLKTTAIGLNAVETSHSDNSGSYLYQLIYTWLVLTCTLPHITKDQTKLYFFFHICVILIFYLNCYSKSFS